MTRALQIANSMWYERNSNRTFEHLIRPRFEGIQMRGKFCCLASKIN